MLHTYTHTHARTHTNTHAQSHTQSHTHAHTHAQSYTHTHAPHETEARIILGSQESVTGTVTCVTLFEGTGQPRQSPPLTTPGVTC